MIERAIIKTPLASIPAGSTIEIAHRKELGFYTSQFGYYDLVLTDGTELKMVDFYNDLQHL